MTGFLESEEFDDGCSGYGASRPSPRRSESDAVRVSSDRARELAKLGHDVRLMPAKDVKAYVKRNKNDAADADPATCDAAHWRKSLFPL